MVFTSYDPGSNLQISDVRAGIFSSPTLVSQSEDFTFLLIASHTNTSYSCKDYCSFENTHKTKERTKQATNPTHLESGYIYSRRQRHYPITKSFFSSFPIAPKKHEILVYAAAAATVAGKKSVLLKRSFFKSFVHFHRSLSHSYDCV